MYNINSSEDIELVSPDNDLLWGTSDLIDDPKNDLSSYLPHIKKFMRDNKILSLSGPCINLPYRFIILGNIVMINPHISSKSARSSYVKETCGIVPDRTKMLLRHDTIDVSWHNEKGHYVCTTLRNKVAQMFQHQMDHLNGVCIFSNPVTDKILENLG